MAEKIDWDAMEPDWRAGIKTKKQLAEEFNVSRAAIDKHWGKAGIERDLTAKIRAAAESKVTLATVTREVTPHTKVTEREVVEVNAQVQADMMLRHRKDVPEKREFVGRLFKELEELTGNQELVEQLTLALQQCDQVKLAEIARKVATLPTRIKGTVDLVGAYKTLISMEREVFGISSTTPIEDSMKRIADVMDPHEAYQRMIKG